jgi:hypothetical protein
MLPSLGGHKYFVLFIDEKSRSSMLPLLSRKGSVKDAFKAFKTRFEKENDAVIKRLHRDRGGEYETLREYMTEDGIRLEKTAAYCLMESLRGSTEVFWTKQGVCFRTQNWAMSSGMRR